MGTLAGMLQDQGHNVTGSDEGFYEPMLGYLTTHNITFYTGHKPENIPNDVDYIVIGKHAKLVPESNPEVAHAFKTPEKVISFPTVINQLTQNKDTIICAGSFGKSSITTLTSFVLEHAGVNPSYFIGAVPIDLADSGKITDSNIFVLEGDEYPSANFDNRAKFLHYNPQNVILTSCEHDHINVYPTVESYLLPYKELLKLIPNDGYLVYTQNGMHIKSVLEKVEDSESGRTTNYNKISYGLNDGFKDSEINRTTNYYPVNISYGPITSFDLHKDGEFIIKLETMLLGEHSILNIVGVSAMLLEKGLVSPVELQNAIKVCHGVKGRLDKKVSNSQIPIIESYGSSYAKAVADISAVKLHYPTKNIICIFEPHTFGWRNRGNLSWYDDAFNGVSNVYIFNPPTHGASTHDQLSLDEILNQVKNSGVNAVGVASKNDAYELLKKDLNNDSLILLMTSGALDGLPNELPKDLPTLLGGRTSK